MLGNVGRNRYLGLLAFGLWFLFAASSFAQIGGKISTDGPFTLDDVEDLNTTASGVDRAWIPTFVNGVDDAFQAIELQTAGIALADQQTSIGALRYAMLTKSGYINYALGVPMPSEPGKSTLDFPGDISSFAEMTFLISANMTLSNQVYSILLEAYPGPAPFPQLVWNFEVAGDSAFHRVTLPLHEPDTVTNNGANYPVEQLLASTRYLSFYFFGGPQTAQTTLTVHVDDIRFIGDATQSGVSDWSVY